jgi:exodeoxyribonuclease V alpha subunit
VTILGLFGSGLQQHRQVSNLPMLLACRRCPGSDYNTRMSDTLTGIIERVTFHNAETGFIVLRVQADKRRDLVTVVGHLPSAAAGDFVEASGVWVQDRDHGLQFKADTLRTTPPHTVEGIEKYLASGLVKGIGKHYARKIVEAFQERTLAVIDESPSFLREIKGIGPQRVQRIRESWQQQKAVRGIMVFLQSHGVGTARAVRIYRTYGERAVELVREDPYRLATDIWGVGFQSADQLAEKLGIDRASPLRARAALKFVLQRLSDEGHCGFPEADVVARTVALTGIDETIVSAAVEHQCQTGELLREPWKDTAGVSTTAPQEPWLYLKPLFLAELGVARALLTLKQGVHPLPAIDVERALSWVEAKMGLQLASSQRAAIRQAITQKVLVITGGPGVGKSTLVRGILEIFAAKGLRCSLCAPTGRAAKRLAETTGREARTIHRLLEFDPALGGAQRTRERPLEVDLLIVDETSMVDVVLMNQLLRAVPAAACVVLVGDVDQLPSVGPGTVLADLIGSGAVPVARLTEIFRQAGHSGIVRAAHAVHCGELPESATAEQPGDFYVIEAATPEAILERIVTLLRERIPVRFGLDALRDVQVLTPMNRAELGARNLNARLQEVLNPAATGEVQRFGWTFHVGDKVMQTVNNYQKEIFNGDIGRIVRIDAEEQEVTVTMDGREVVYDFGELDEMVLAFSTTIHKAQGAEYPAVVIALHTQHFMMLQRNLLYTAITRGRKLVVIVGNAKALRMAVERQDTAQRCTGLQWRLMHG